MIEPLAAAGFLLAAAAVLALGLAVLVATGGGPIQQVVRGKTASTDLCSATLIDLLFGMLLLALASWSPTPLSTTAGLPSWRVCWEPTCSGQGLAWRSAWCWRG